MTQGLLQHGEFLTVDWARQSDTAILLLNRVSYNAGVVKYFFPTLLHPLRDERHFALVEISAISTKARS